MTWRVRHQGSPREVSGVTRAEVVDGLRDGLWDTCDEVRGPHDTAWVSIEDHAEFAEAAADCEISSPTPGDDETRLDMNALIDVCLVLLIFFILTISYQTLEKVLDMPRGRAQDDSGVKAVSQDRVENYMILVKAATENGAAAIWVEGDRVPEDQLATVLKRVAREKRRSELLLDAEGIEYGTVVKIIDAAGSAKIEQVHFLDRAAGAVAERSGSRAAP